eukprot:994086-Rhodomonas_salina.1
MPCAALTRMRAGGVLLRAAARQGAGARMGEQRHVSGHTSPAAAANLGKERAAADGVPPLGRLGDAAGR